MHFVAYDISSLWHNGNYNKLPISTSWGTISYWKICIGGCPFTRFPARSCLQIYCQCSLYIQILGKRVPVSNQHELSKILPLISFKIWKLLVLMMPMFITPRQEVHEGELSGPISLRELWKSSQERLGILASLFNWTSPTFPLLPLPLFLSWKYCSECWLRLNPRWKLRIYFKMHGKFQGILEKGKLPWSYASGCICDWRSWADVSMLKMLLRILGKATCFPVFLEMSHDHSCLWC